MDLWDLGILIANRAYQAGRPWKQPWIWGAKTLGGDLHGGFSPFFDLSSFIRSCIRSLFFYG